MDELASLSTGYGEQYDKLENSASLMGERPISLSNDSILHQLATERARVDRLREELNTVRVTDRKRINELQNEVGSLRKILQSYVVQIDSLHRTNQQLRAENQQVKADYRKATAEASRLKGQTEELSDRVALATKLSASGINVSPLDKRGKVSKRLSRTETLSISFTIAQNITAAVGNKPFYIRIMLPTGDLMSGDGGSFDFEGKSIAYTAKKTIEYTGEDTSVTMYRPISEALPEGEYRLQIFADGNLIGQSTFALKD